MKETLFINIHDRNHKQSLFKHIELNNIIPLRALVFEADTDRILKRYEKNYMK